MKSINDLSAKKVTIAEKRIYDEVKKKWTTEAFRSYFIVFSFINMQRYFNICVQKKNSEKMNVYLICIGLSGIK